MTEELLPLLAFLASTAGSGYAASWLLERARVRWPKPSRAQWAAYPRRRVLWAVLWAPRYVRWSALALAALVSLAANFLLSYHDGMATKLALDAALAAVVSQVKHSLTLPKEATR